MAIRHHGTGVGRFGRAGADTPPLVHRVDLAVSAIILAVCALLFYVTATFDEVSPLLAQNIPPQFFPRLLLILIAGLALILPFEHLLLARRGRNIDAGRRSRIAPMAYATAGLLVLVVFLMPWLGTYLTMVGVCVLLPLLWGERRLKLLIPFALLFPTAIALLFSQILQVFFAPGIFGISFH